MPNADPDTVSIGRWAKTVLLPPQFSSFRTAPDLNIKIQPSNDSLFS